MAGVDAVDVVAFWRDAGQSGEAYLKPGSVRATADACTADGVPALSAFVVASEASRPLSAPERQAAVLADLSRLFGDAAASPTDFAFHDWGTDPFALHRLNAGSRAPEWWFLERAAGFWPAGLSGH